MQSDLVTRLWKVDGYYTHLIFKIDEERAMPNFAALRCHYSIKKHQEAKTRSVGAQVKKVKDGQRAGGIDRIVNSVVNSFDQKSQKHSFLQLEQPFSPKALESLSMLHIKSVSAHLRLRARS